MPNAEPFIIMVKPVGPLCNMNCSYCYYLETADLYKLPHQFRMSDPLIERCIQQHIAASLGPIVQFVWHGGEPTLAGLDFYRHVVDLQKYYLPQGWSCWNNLQTNGILLDEEWCSFLADAHFDVGLSIDGTEWLHDAGRKDLGGQVTYKRVVAAIQCLQSHGIQPDLLCVVTSEIAKEPLSVYRTLRKFDTGWIQFIPIIRHTNDGQVTSELLTGKAYGRFLCAIFDEWVHHDIGKLEVQLFAEMSLALSGGTANPCWMAPTCGRVLIVEHDGSVYACDHFVDAEHRIGDIVTSSLSELVNAPVQRRFGNEKQDRLTTQCRSCSWLYLCNGGCPKDRFAPDGNSETGLNYLCDGLRQFFAHAKQPLERIVEQRKYGVSPEAIMSDLSTELVARWKGVGRNDPCPCGSGRKAKQCCWEQRL